MGKTVTDCKLYQEERVVRGEPQQPIVETRSGGPGEAAEPAVWEPLNEKFGLSF